MENCIFCKIVKGEIPSFKVYENDDFVAFLDITPRNSGHSLVIPKKHYRWVWDIEEEYSTAVNKVANALKKTMGTEYVQSVVMGDEVPHAHIHLIPRLPGDGHGGIVNFSHVKDIPKEEMQRIADRIKEKV